MEIFYSFPASHPFIGNSIVKTNNYNLISIKDTVSSFPPLCSLSIFPIIDLALLSTQFIGKVEVRIKMGGKNNRT